MVRVAVSWENAAYIIYTTSVIISNRQPTPSGQEEQYLVQYLAKYCKNGDNPSERHLYEVLVENVRATLYKSLSYLNYHTQAEAKWPWAEAHTSDRWRDLYMGGREIFDPRINQLRIIQGQNVARTKPSLAQNGFMGHFPQVFADINDDFLTKYLAIQTPDAAGRNGHRVYEHLVSHVCLTEHIPSRERNLFVYLHSQNAGPGAPYILSRGGTSGT